jgi:hypothetical protein
MMSFLASHKVKEILVSDHNPDLAGLHTLLSPFTARPLEAGGVELFRVLPEAITSNRDVTGVEAERRADTRLFSSMVAAAWM